ncbi:uncharacterized protein LOC121856716 [Homarus americanus]|nr:uncharacterized protein LOC121856716 [Homarus americanus]
MNNSGGPVAKDDSNDGDNSSFSFVYTNKKKPVRQISPVRTESSWTKKGDARGALSSTFSLGSRSTEIDTSCEENFPALGACGSIKGAVKKSSCQLTPFGGPVKGVKLDAMPEVADMPAVADLKLDDKSEFGVWGVSANEFSNPLMTFGRAGRKVKLEDMSEVGRGQKSPNQRSKRGGL